MTTIDVATLAEAQAHEQRLREQAGELRLHGLLGRWAEVMGNPEQSRWVGQLLGWEAAERHRRSGGAVAGRVGVFGQGGFKLEARHP